MELTSQKIIYNYISGVARKPENRYTRMSCKLIMQSLYAYSQGNITIDKTVLATVVKQYNQCTHTRR